MSGKRVFLVLLLAVTVTFIVSRIATDLPFWGEQEATSTSTDAVTPTPGPSATAFPESLCDGSTMDMVDCLDEVLEGLNRELASAYSSTRSNLAEQAAAGAFRVSEASPPFTVYPVKELSQSQRLFKAYRDSMCQTAYDAWIGGSIRSLNSLSCQISLTREHITQLQGLVGP